MSAPGRLTGEYRSAQHEGTPVSATLLVELLSEELPPKALKMLGEEFASLVTNGLAKAGIVSTQPPAIHATPRRLALQLAGIPPRAEDRAVAVKLMPAKVAFDASG